MIANKILRFLFCLNLFFAVSKLSADESINKNFKDLSLYLEIGGSFPVLFSLINIDYRFVQNFTLRAGLGGFAALSEVYPYGYIKVCSLNYLKTLNPEKSFSHLEMSLMLWDWGERVIFIPSYWIPLPTPGRWHCFQN